MFENEKDYFTALGLEAPEETEDLTEGEGENEREDAEPAAELGDDDMFPDELPDEESGSDE